MISSHEEYRHKRARLLRDVIDRGLVGKTLIAAEVVTELPEKAYRSGGLETIFGFYEAMQLGTETLRGHLSTLYGTDDEGLARMVGKIEDVLGQRFVAKYRELKQYIQQKG